MFESENMECKCGCTKFASTKRKIFFLCDKCGTIYNEHGQEVEVISRDESKSVEMNFNISYSDEF